MRQDPPATGSEPDQLTAFLDFQRETVLSKAEGLDAQQFRRPLPPSSLTLGGLLFHLALVEESWFEERFLGLPVRLYGCGVTVVVSHLHLSDALTAETEQACPIIVWRIRGRGRRGRASRPGRRHASGADPGFRIRQGRGPGRHRCRRAVDARTQRSIGEVIASAAV